MHVWHASTHRPIVAKYVTYERLFVFLGRKKNARGKAAAAELAKDEGGIKEKKLSRERYLLLFAVDRYFFQRNKARGGKKKHPHNFMYSKYLDKLFSDSAYITCCAVIKDLEIKPTLKAYYFN